MRQFYVYILASRSRRLYIGVTNDLRRRVFEHRLSCNGFTARYHITRLVHFEVTSNAMAAMEREKQLKGWIRRRKISLIETANPGWLDIATDWYE